MNKSNKCKNCQWYGKPYWSIINPCDNCPMENVETFTQWIDPTIQEKDKKIERLNNIINELEKLIDSYELGKYDYEIPVFILKDKLKELKEQTNE